MSRRAKSLVLPANQWNAGATPGDRVLRSLHVPHESTGSWSVSTAHSEEAPLDVLFASAALVLAPENRHVGGGSRDCYSSSTAWVLGWWRESAPTHRLRGGRLGRVDAELRWGPPIKPEYETLRNAARVRPHPRLAGPQLDPVRTGAGARLLATVLPGPQQPPVPRNPRRRIFCSLSARRER